MLASSSADPISSNSVLGCCKPHQESMANPDNLASTEIASNLKSILDKSGGHATLRHCQIAISSDFTDSMLNATDILQHN